MNLPSGWEWKEFKDCATFVNGMAFKPTDWESQGLPIIRIQNLTNNREDIHYFSRPYNKKYEVNKGDLLIAWSASLGVFIWRGDKAILNQHIFKVVFDKKNTDKYFFYFYVKLKIASMFQYTNGSTMKHITKKVFENIKIPLPPLETQRHIAQILSNLDEKIELNNNINKSLESLARLIYTQYFVQFDFPNAQNKPYKSSGGKMIYNNILKRHIPQGWEVAKLGDLVSKNNQKSTPNKDKKLIDLSIMPQHTMCLNQLNSGDMFDTNLYEMNKYDLLFGAIRPYLKKAGFAPCDGLVNGTIHSFKPNNEFMFNFLVCVVTGEAFFKFAISNSRGTKMPVVSYDDLMEFKIPFNAKQIESFNNKIAFKEIISQNIMQSHALASLRDFLLPLLMNGQVRIKA